MALFGIGLAFKTGDITFDPCDSDHVVAQFLAAYFIEEPGAIYQVKDVSVTNIARSKKNHTAILAARPPKPTKSTPSPPLAPTLTELFKQDYKFGDEGLVSIGPGEMWHPTAEKPEIEAFEAVPEVLDWTPPDPALPDSPDLRSRDDPFDLWLDSLAPSVDEPPSKLPRISV